MHRRCPVSDVLKESVVRAKLRWAGPAAILLIMSLALVWVVRARRAVEEAGADAAHSSVPFEIYPVSASRATLVDPLPAPPDFRDAQIFHESLYVAAAGGLWVYDL